MVSHAIDESSCACEAQRAIVRVLCEDAPVIAARELTGMVFALRGGSIDRECTYPAIAT